LCTYNVVVSSPPSPCPLQANAYYFTYNNESGGFCRSPTSYVRQCAANSRLLFSFKQCQQSTNTFNRGTATTPSSPRTANYWRKWKITDAPGPAFPNVKNAHTGWAKQVSQRFLSIAYPIFANSYFANYFQKFFTGTLCGKFVIMWLLSISLRNHRSLT